MIVQAIYISELNSATELKYWDSIYYKSKCCKIFVIASPNELFVLDHVASCSKLSIGKPIPSISIIIRRKLFKQTTHLCTKTINFRAAGNKKMASPIKTYLLYLGTEYT